MIDMDGVTYREKQLIPGADRFIASLLDRHIPFAFLTNNSQRTRRDVATKLTRMGIFVDEEHIFTCAMATARFLAAQKPGGTAFVIGEGGLLQALHKNGYAIVDDDPDYVVVGEGRTFNMEIVEAAVRMILRGSKLIATNIDPNELVEEAFLRRIQTKIRMGAVSAEHFHEIFKRACEPLKLRYQRALVDATIHNVQEQFGQPLRACIPRDLLHQIVWQARYEGKEPALTAEAIERACRAYFVARDTPIG